MITTRMTSEEILKEYRLDYQEFFRPYLKKLCNRKLHDLKKRKDIWIKVKDPVIISSVRGNKYRSLLSLRYNKKNGSFWKTVTFLETSDSITGKKVTYIMSDVFPIMLTSGFIKELGRDISDFLRNKYSWDINTNDELKDERYSAWMKIDDTKVGVGGWKDGILILRHISPYSDDPLQDFLKSRENFQEEEKKSEIDLAWEAYLRGELETV